MGHYQHKVIYLNIEAKKLADVDFNVDKGVDQVRFVWKKGKLFISLSSIFLNSKNVWYEVPIDNIKDIEIGEDNKTIHIIFDHGKLVLHSKNVEVLMALRHFLLPYLT